MALALAGSLVTACRRPADPAPQSATPAPAALPESTASTRDLMLALLDASADVVWESVAVSEDATGLHARRPQTLEEWDTIRAHAAVITEGANLLLLPSRARDTGEWTTRVQELVAAARDAERAAGTQDVEALRAAGDRLYLSCADCHERYMVAAPTPGGSR